MAWRGRRRWAQELVPAPADPVAEPLRRLRQGGVYLVTGGLGGIGLEIAEHLTAAVRPKLVLVGRSGLPPRDRWEEILGSAAAVRERRRIEKVLALEARGAEVLVLAADVADREAMEQVIAETRRRFGAIHGVVHSAGLTGGGLLAVRSPEAVRALMAPKVRGTLVLAELLDGEPLDFVVLCSSLTGVLGGLAHVDYTAANAFLDAFAWSRWARGEDGVRTIDWAVWSQVGMAVELGLSEGLPAGSSLDEIGIPSRDGVEIFRRALAGRRPQWIVSPVDLHARIAQIEALSRAGAALAASAPPPSAGHVRPELSTAYAEPRDATEAVVVAVFQKVLGIDRVGIHDSFFQLGGHSLVGLQVLARLREELRIEVPLRTLFEEPTAAGLAACVAGIAGIAGGAGAQTVPEIRSGMDAEEVLESLDELSDREVEALLAEMTADQEEMRERSL